MARIIAALILPFCAFSAQAQELTIQGFQLGADLKAEADRTGNHCSPRPPNEGATNCGGMPAPTIAGVAAKAVLLRGFDNKLGVVYFSFQESDYRAVRDAFALKYPTMKCSSSSVKSRGGIEFDQEVCLLSRGGATLDLRRRAGNVETGSVSVTTEQFMKSHAEFEKTRAAEAQKDI